MFFLVYSSWIIYGYVYSTAEFSSGLIEIEAGASAGSEPKNKMTI